MGVRLRGSTGECVCSICFMAVEPGATFCDSCGTILEGELAAKNCPSCDTLISVEAKICPVCNKKLELTLEGREEEKAPVKLDGEDEAFLAKLLTWRKVSESSIPDTEEDRKEREHAMKVLKSIGPAEPEAIEGQIKEIEDTAKEREVLEKRRKQLLKLGKPFETVLERNITEMNLIESELEKKNAELKLLEGEEGKKAQEVQSRLKDEIEQLQTKKQTMTSQEQKTLMIGGAYRRLLEQQQNELNETEANLKKKVEAFQKEIDRRKKQKIALKRREESLNEREEELSNRFLDLKRRENEIKASENNLQKGLEELKAKEEDLRRWESEIAAGKHMEAETETDKDGNGKFNKEVWLKEQGELQADLFKMREEIVEAEKSRQKLDRDDEFKKMEDSLKEREREMDEFKNQLKELSAFIIEKDREIERLKGGEREFSVDQDTRKLLMILDDLLEELSEDVVDKFAKSDDYLLYERVLEKYKL